jgi:hypothetical protein
VLLVQHTTQQPEEVIIIITGKEAKCGAWGFPSVILYLQKKPTFTWVIFLFSAVSWLKLGLLEGCHILLHPFVGLQLELTNINYVLAY